MTAYPKKVKRPPRPLYKTLVTKADKAMSLYIRQKFAVDGYVTCVSCGRFYRWQEVDCGHFIPKGRSAALRYVEENVAPECPGCNRFNDGHLIGYTLYIIDTYGREKIDELKQASRQVLTPAQKRTLAEEAISYYSNALKEL